MTALQLDKICKLFLATSKNSIAVHFYISKRGLYVAHRRYLLVIRVGAQSFGRTLPRYYPRYRSVVCFDSIYYADTAVQINWFAKWKWHGGPYDRPINQLGFVESWMYALVCRSVGGFTSWFTGRYVNNF